MKREKRAQKILFYEKRHSDLLEKRPSAYRETAYGIEIMTTDLVSYYHKLEAESMEIAHHRLMYYLENNEFYPVSQ